MEILVPVGGEREISLSDLLGCSLRLDQETNTIAGSEPLEAPGA
jgi:hypothetical protein